jgi:hypothetical protein
MFSLFLLSLKIFCQFANLLMIIMSLLSSTLTVFFVKDLDTRAILLSGRCLGGLYALDDPAFKQVFSALKASSTQWHARLGHPSSQIVQHILSRNKLPSVSSKSSVVCDACQQGKSHQLPFYVSQHVTTAPLELNYSDVWGPAQTSVSGHNYYVSFVDAYSRFTWLYLIKRKSDVFDVFLQFQSHVERLLHHKILHVQSDWGGEYIKLHTFFQNIGISQRVSCPHTHQQNGSAERKHRHIVETGLTLLAHAFVPFRYWSDAVTTACFLINRMPTRVINMETPLERLLGEKPDYTFFKVFGCACWPNLRPYNNHKLEFRSKKCVFLGYSPIHKGYRCLHIPSNRLYISRDVVFDEIVFPFSNLPSSESPSTNSSVPVSLDQFEDYAYAPLLLPNHGAGIGRGARLELLDEPAPLSPQTPTVAARSQNSMQLHGTSPPPGVSVSPGSTGSSTTLVDPVLISPAVSQDPTSPAISSAEPLASAPESGASLFSPAPDIPSSVVLRPVTRSLRGVHQPKKTYGWYYCLDGFLFGTGYCRSYCGTTSLSGRTEYSTLARSNGNRV